MLKISKVVFNEKSTYTELNLDLESSEIYIDKSSIGKDITEKINYNFLAVGRKNTEAKKIIAELANNGFFLTAHSKGISLFKNCLFMYVLLDRNKIYH